VALALDYLPETLEELRSILKNVPYGGADSLTEFCQANDFSLSEVVIDEECTDNSLSNNGGDYWKTHREIIIYEDEYLNIYINCNYHTSYDDSCCEFCGRYGSQSCCEQPSIFAVRK